jgi:isopentenyl diphosphate isomerase/L-lactate dehydrogenase-like FMN-dependent dehydrogenase
MTAVDELAAKARELLPDAAWSYIADGAGCGRALAANVAAFDRFRLVPRALVDVSEGVTLRTRLLGRDAQMPIGVAPMAGQVMVHEDAELAAARGAAQAGAVFCMPCMSTAALAQVPASAHAPRWYQLYVSADRGQAQDAVCEAARCGFDAVVLTVDMRVPGDRPVWRGAQGGDGDSAAQHVAALRSHASSFDQSLVASDLAWIREVGGLPVVVKGVLCGADAGRIVDAGAQAVVVSNHGGRQLDRSVAPMDVLAEVVDAVGGRAQVYVDGGVRGGEDVAIALALGADAAFVGRPVLHAAAVAGEAGVARLLEMLGEQLRTTMALLGVTSVDALQRDHVRVGAGGGWGLVR